MRIRVGRARELLTLASLNNGVVPVSYKCKGLFKKVTADGLSADEEKELKRLQVNQPIGVGYITLLQRVVDGKA